MSEAEDPKIKTLYCVLHILFVTAATAGVEVFLVLCLRYFRSEWPPALWMLALVGGSVLLAAMLITDLCCYFLHKTVVSKFILTLYLMLLFFATVGFALLRTGFIEIMRDENSLKEYLERSGRWVSFVFILLQFLQVVVLPIPSTVTVAAGAALFGAFRGSLYSLIGIVLGSFVAFLVGRYAGYRVVAWLIGKETLDKWLKKIKGKDMLLLTAMFLLPVFPDDVLCFVAGISSMSAWYFLVVILISRVLAIFTTSYFVTLIPFNTWWGLLIWGVFIVAVAVLFIVLYKKSDAILNWFEKIFHRETRVENKTAGDEFTIQVVDPDGSLRKKGVKKGEEKKDGKD